jgi:hypothetical protein
MGGDESRFGDCSRRAGLPPRLNGQDLVEGTTIVIGGRDWLVADASTYVQTKFVCTPLASAVAIEPTVSSSSLRSESQL